ncbi:hypothetical protein PC9H_000231 [Pleurotus ostreatus]|uniref:Nucleic-acid-binding protein from transposon X-element n=1 Tax=Pleurotus ostreatus TaxID=5322 RepID=A0A8H7DV24_PLEOS|nr:uncharacterized protein PC9H_000231 [Pleurotus ostreatus]KAF7439894.1 hypothetical protein PC9H_000231 [Pleurotus ostreatus]
MSYRDVRIWARATVPGSLGNLKFNNLANQFPPNPGASNAQPSGGFQTVEAWPQLLSQTPPPRPPSAFESEFGDPKSVPNLDDFYVRPRPTASDRVDATPTRKRARIESNNALPPPTPHRAYFAAIRRGGGTRDMSCTEWSRACVELLGDIVDGARSTLGWTDDGDAVAEVLSVAKALKNTLREIDSMVSVDDDIFMSQPSAPAPAQDKGFDGFKSEIKDLFLSLEVNLSSRISNVERRLGSVPLPSSVPNPTQITPSSRPQAPTPSSYASAAKSAPSSQPKPAQQPKAVAPAPASKSNTKFVVRFRGRLPPEAERKSSHVLFHALNHAFSNNAAARNDGLEILGAEWNRSGNIILTFPSHVNPNAVYNHINLLHPIVDHGLDEVIISHDTKWSKAVCSRVPSVGFDGHYWDSKALGVLLRRNPIIKSLKITQEPRFVSNPAEGLPPVAPVVFAFEDPDGSKLKELLKTPIFMDGRHTPVRPWREKPRLTQCDRCQGLGHTAKLCAKPHVCAKCAQRHPTTEHNVYCPSVLKDGSSSCKCTPKCANCEGEHWATDGCCPEKRKFVPRPVPPLAPPSQMSLQPQRQPQNPPAPPHMQVDT